MPTCLWLDGAEAALPLPGSTEFPEVQPESAKAPIKTTREKPTKGLRRDITMLSAIMTQSPRDHWYYGKNYHYSMESVCAVTHIPIKRAFLSPAGMFCLPSRIEIH
ncbi:hypothetical protein BN874_1650004 [Candidatus Contendobacter odensis Run_B_J11]|uniref:Uncharacterized protein n=1 Tax=Candidatus Contendobacter odensis Run_B_J11 TaxID=1400861 RepID=A0A7U7J3J2_9GAMM|nr:hypothetical protein BN874_1650004 [Candidatus Contendobacter odensis Run_B_J11]